MATAPNVFTEKEHRGTDSVDAGRKPMPGTRVAYVMSRFPKLTETFVLREMRELESLDYDVHVFPLQREKAAVIQPDAQAFVDRAHFAPFLSWAILWSNLTFLFRRPARYLKTLCQLVAGNFGSLRYLAGALVFFPKTVHFASRMERLGVAHVHAHFASHPAAMAYAVGQLVGIPYSFTAHGSDLHRDQHMLREKTAGAAFVVAISRYNRRMILDVCGSEFADKVHVIHCGIDPGHFSPRTEPTSFQRGDGPFKIVCIGTLHEVKGQTHLIEACRRLHNRGFEFSCHLLGAGPDAAKLRRQAEQAGLSHAVTFHGLCTTPQVQQHLRDADVLAAPSVPSRDGRREGIPVVLMEAMASGVACVASRLSGIPELVEDGQTGLLAPPGDAAALAAAIEKLATDTPWRRRLAAAGVEKVRRDFHLGRNCAALAACFSGNRHVGREGGPQRATRNCCQPQAAAPSPAEEPSSWEPCS